MILDEGSHAIERQFRVAYCRDLLGDFGPAGGEIGFGLTDGVLIVRVVDLDQQLVGFYEIAFVHVQLGDVAVHPRKDVDDLIGRDIRRIG